LAGIAIIIGVVGVGTADVLADVVASFFVTDPIQTANVSQGTGIDATSEVNVADPDATNGYFIKAKLRSNLTANFNILIWADSHSSCTATNKCQLTTTDRLIYVNYTDSATIGSGDVITFNVSINSTAGATIAQHDIYIDYTKERVPKTMQTFSTATCSYLEVYPGLGSELDLKDIRDDKVYKIRKLADNHCWMVDNLALQGLVTLNSATSDLVSGTYALPSVQIPSGSYCTSLSTTTYPHQCGYHYILQQATAGSTIANGDAPNSICPKNWRLPVYGEYGALSTALSWGTSGTNINNSAWRGLYAGHSTSTNVGVRGYFWTSRRGASTFYFMRYGSDIVSEPDGYSTNADAGTLSALSIRCLAR
jgi:uncharacterized protein (TIGR02145 family)